MPEFTIYAIIQRKKKSRHKLHHKTKNTPILRLHDWPISWYDLKNTINDAGRQIFNEHGQLESEISIDRHLAGKYVMGMINYRDSRIRFNRVPEFRAKINYNPKTDTVKIKNASFLSFNSFERYKLDHDLDVKKKWSLKPVVSPNATAELINPDAIFRNLFRVQTLNYDPLVIGVAGSYQERHQTMPCYDALPHDVYGSSDENTIERDRAVKQGRVKM